MKLAARIDIGITEFWEITPAELNIYAEAYIQRREAEQKQQYENSIIQSYLTSRWVWQKQVNVNKYLTNDRMPAQKRTMTDAEMLQKVKALNAIFGGTVTKNLHSSNLHSNMDRFKTKVDF